MLASRFTPFQGVPTGLRDQFREYGVGAWQCQDLGSGSLQSSRGVRDAPTRRKHRWIEGAGGRLTIRGILSSAGDRWSACGARDEMQLEREGSRARKLARRPTR